MSDERRKGRQGFASMPPAKVREIASQGGRAAHAKGTAHEWDRSEAQAAGRKGSTAKWRHEDGAHPVGCACEECSVQRAQAENYDSRDVRRRE